MTPLDLPDAINRALAGESILILPQARTGAVTEVAPDRWLSPGDAPALILFTSGSTGAAKAVALSAHALTASARATERFLSGPGRWHLTLPVNHIAGFQVELRARLAGEDPVRAAAGPFTAQAFAAEVAELVARGDDRPRYTSLVPTQLHRVLADPAATSAAATFTAILLGGSAISPALLDAAAAADLRIVRTYGMSETAGGCVYDGVAFDGVTVTITEAGTIDLTGPVVADAYVDVTADGTIVPRDSLALTGPVGGRTIHTSDLGHLDDGVLSVLGRVDDVIVSGGENVSPHALETALLPVWQPHGVAEVLVTAVADAEWGRRIVALVRLADDTAGAGQLRGLSPTERGRRLRALAPAEAGTMLPREVIVVDEIPARSIGKPDRRRAAEVAESLLARPHS
ncbi:o-succinylbenzoate--CoA ligase [Brevibacterium sanguinis]|uniref:AMP-binding protein n=1 Tax=Brevibacterium TaxID=1696 RepID=UPI00112782AE|nr:AMP-binding protein [Brevibacterium sp. XM4083]MCM1013544.1 AMP-binding protein [Brevibacterium sp. XM4083]